jgi:hypothetical protein
MLLMWIRRNKYKLMVFIIGLYLLVDVAAHKGLTRLLFPKTFPVYRINDGNPQNKHILINKNKEWVKAVNTKELLNKVTRDAGGIEADIYFNPEKNIFEVHHDPGVETGFDLEDLFNGRAANGLQGSVWIDLKNLDDSNHVAAVSLLSGLRNKYDLHNKVLVESGRADLLGLFSDSGFYTSYYVPLFNPYLINDDEIRHWVDSLSNVLNRSTVNALSGYYFQYPFLHLYFPKYPVLTWAEKGKFSLVNWLFRRKLANAGEIFIVLY